jgi:hypothetical protein
LRESQKRDKRRAKDERRAARKAAKNDTNAPAAQIGGGGATLKGESAP